MDIKIIETRDLDKSGYAENICLVRLLDIDGVRHLQMQARQHEHMKATWYNGVLMKCPKDLTLDAVEADPWTYFYARHDGCDLWLDVIPKELWQ